MVSRRTSWAVGLGALVCSGCLLTTSLGGLHDGVAAGPLGDAGASDAPSDAPPLSDAGADATPPSAYRAAILADGAIAYWRLGDKGSAKSAKDVTGNGHDGLYGGSIVLGVPGAIAGDPDTAARFDGVSTLLEVGDTFRFDGTTPFTIETWVRPDATGSYALLLGRNEDPNGYGLFLTPTFGTVFERQKSGADDVIDGPQLGSASFSHLVATYDGSLQRLFVNGVIVAAPQPSGAISGSTAPFTLGVAQADGTGNRGWFKGDLDEPAVYDHALSDSQILAHYKLGVGL